MAAKEAPTVTFNGNAQGAARVLTSKEIEDKLAKGAKISNTALSHHYAKTQPGYGGNGHRPANVALAALQASQVSEPYLDRSDESAVAINPQNTDNMVAGAATFDGTQFTNSAYVTRDGGAVWLTVTALTDTDEGAALAFDDSGNCYYATMQGGFAPVCTVSPDGGLSWRPPARFGSGDKTAVAARGKTALVGFDRINTEACAFTLDGGATWTVNDFTDSGIGTAPLVSYDQQSFYIIYGALDNNIKMYASHDRGSTWTGPTVIVAGNAPESTIGGPLSYEGGALTCPGTNVGIDASGTIHVLYIDSTNLVPMYTASSDQGATWSPPVNVNPERASDTHMWPCLSCNRDGDLQAGSLAYDAVAGNYAILRHSRASDQASWSTEEADNGPWFAAGPSPGFRIGFGDYFDCDSDPNSGIGVMAWSGTPNGAQPWQTWARTGVM